MGSIHEGRGRRAALRVAAVCAAALIALAVAAPAEVAGPGDANGSRFVLTGFDFDTNVVSGTNSQFSLASPYDAETWFLAAKLDRYQPGDPCREAAIRYNDAIGAGLGDTGGSLEGALDGLAADGCYARVILGSPYFPTDPTFPSDPIRQFEPRALPPSPI